MSITSRALIAPFVLTAFALAPLAHAQSSATKESLEAKMAVAETSLTSGTYKNDPNHTSLSVELMHLGLAPYAVQLADIDAALTLDVKNPSKSSVSFDVDPMSVFTSYRGDYKATHKDSKHSSWEEAVAKDFLGAEAQEMITFRSTRFDYAGGKTGTVYGDLSMNGITKPAQFAIEMTGEGEHPFTKKMSLGIVAKGTVLRTDYEIAEGYNAFLGDEVTVSFSADFSKADE